MPTAEAPPAITTPGFKRRFLAKPATASLLYLVSAACLLGAAAVVLAPWSDDAELLAPRIALLATVEGYIATVVLLAALVCRWRAGNDDAVALGVVLALLVPVLPAALIPLAAQSPLLALALGGGTWLLALACLGVLQRRVTGPWSWGLLLPLALIQAWHAVSPGLMALAQARHPTGWGATQALLRAWLPGWWLVVAAGALLTLAAWRAQPAQPPVDGGDRTARITGPGLRWVLTALALAAGTTHQWLLTYAHDLGVTGWELAGLAAVAVPAADLLLCRWRLASSGGMAVIACAVAMILVFGADTRTAIGDAGGPLALIGAIAQAPVHLLIGGLGLALLAWKRWSPDTALAAVVWLLDALLMWGGGWNLPAAGVAVFILATLLVAFAPPHRLLWLLVATMCLATLGQEGQQVLPALATTAALAVRAVRLRSGWTALATAVPLAVHGTSWLGALWLALGGWLAVLAAFPLLCAGAWLSWRRTQAGTPGTGAGAPLPTRSS